MNIISTNKELTNKEKYFLTTSSEIRPMREIAGEEVNISVFLLYTSTDVKGNDREVLAIGTDAGEYYATNSPSFISSFHDILDCFGNDFSRIKVVEGTSRNNRKFLTAAYIG